LLFHFIIFFLKNKKLFIIKKQWWPQAEAMIGFFNAWETTGQETYLEKSLNSWKFVQQHILDAENGEWFWGVNEKYEVMNEDKVGLWKCPYHNGRACIELITRINKIITNWQHKKIDNSGEKNH